MRPIRLFRFFVCALAVLTYSTLAWSANEISKVDLVRVKKSESKLYLFSGGRQIAVFDVVFGGNPQGHKQKEGDGRTPEGHYLLDYKKENSAFYKSIHISYPNAADLIQAEKLGVKPGGAVMIHGQKNGFGWLEFLTQHFNWTNGCIALRDEDMDIVWDSVDAGTKIEIE